MKDKNGVEIKKGDTVDVPEPIADDLYNHGFRSVVDEESTLHGFVMVVDGDGIYYPIEPERLEVIDENIHHPVIIDENLPIEGKKKWKIPVIWESWGLVEIEAESLEEAIKIFDETNDDISLPLYPEYVDGSFKREDEESCSFNNM